MDQGIDEEPQIDVWSPTRAMSKVEVKNSSSNDVENGEESKPDSDASALGPAASSESESSQGEASPPHNLLERVSDLSISDFEKVAALALQMDGIKANTALDFRCLKEAGGLKEFTCERCGAEGTCADTWEQALLMVEDPEWNLPELKGNKVQQVSVGEVAKAMESHRRHCPVEEKLCVAASSPSQFRRKARGLQQKILVRAELAGQKDLAFGFKHFKTCLSPHTLLGLQREAVRNNHALASPRQQFDLALQCLGGEQDPNELEELFEDRSGELRTGRFQHADVMHKCFSDLLAEFSGPGLSNGDEVKHFGKPSHGHCLAEKFAAPLVGVRPGEVDALVDHLRPFEEGHRGAMPVRSDVAGLPVGKTQKECNHFKKGRCQHGNRCKFLHVQDGFQKNEPKCTEEQLEQMKLQDCKLFKTGHCGFGNECKFEHAVGQGAMLHESAPGLATHACEDVPALEPQACEKTRIQPEGPESLVLGIEEQLMSQGQGVDQKKPCDLDPTLRSRKKLKCFLRGEEGAPAVMALADDGAQPTSISEGLCQRLAQEGVQFKSRSVAGVIGGLNSSVTDKIVREVEFFVQIKKLKKSGECIGLKIFALVLSGPVSQDSVMGIDAQSVCRVVSLKDPDPAKRLVSINGDLVHSHPCNVDVASTDVATVLGMEMASVRFLTDAKQNADPKVKGDGVCLDGLSPEVQRESKGSADHDFINDQADVIEGLDLPDIDVQSVANPMRSDKSVVAKLGEILPISQFGDQRGVANSELCGGHVLQMLDRMEKEKDTGVSMLQGMQQFCHLRMTVCRFQKHLVEKLPEVGKCKSKEPHDVQRWLEPGVKPVRQRPCHLEPSELELMKSKLDQMVQDGLCFKVADNTSEWSSPAFGVCDKGKALPRIVVAMGGVNGLTRLMHAVCPVTKDTIRGLMGANWVIVSDGKAAWRQLGSTHCAMMVFVFVTLFGSFASEGLPMGHKNAPQVWAEEMATRFLVGMPDTIVHFDDFFTVGQSPMQALLAFACFVQQCEHCDDHQSVTELHVFPKRLAAVGLIKEDGSHHPDPQRTSAMDELARPVKGRRFSKHVRRIIGLFVCRLEHVQGFWDVAAPIKALSVKDAVQEWTDAHDASLDKLKRMLKEAVLHVPDCELISVDAPFIVDTDASDAAGGATLSQITNGKERLLSCHSFAWKASERAWHIVRKELTAGAKGLHRFQHTMSEVDGGAVQNAGQWRDWVEAGRKEGRAGGQLHKRLPQFHVEF